MNPQPAPPPPEFDRYAGEYDRALAEGLSVSGESKDYFAKGRALWLADCLRQLGFSLSVDATPSTALPPTRGPLRRTSRAPSPPLEEKDGMRGSAPQTTSGRLISQTDRPRRHVQSILDYGCGTGSATPFLAECLGFNSLLGVDVSRQSLEVARRTHGSDKVRFLAVDEYVVAARMDLAFCNGVFHHIPPAARAEAVDVVHRSLAPGGLFAFWENNPWNPGTRFVMSRIPFDRDAITLTPPEARRMLSAGGFEIVRTDFLFIFPRMLGWFRRFERHVASLPFGAQYQVLCRKRG